MSSILSGEGARLVTVTGPGGVGKTRLAIEVASGLAELFPGGVVFVPLAPLQDAALVPSAIAKELGVSESADQPLLEMLKRHLRSQRALLVLDNYEHVLDAAGVAAELLAAAPGVAILATSRVPYASTVSTSTPSIRSPSPTPTGCPRSTKSRTSTPWHFSMLALAPRTDVSSSPRPTLPRSPRSVHGSTACRSRSSSLLRA